MSNTMFRTLLVIALCGASMGVLLAADQSTLDINETNGGFLIKKNIFDYPIIMNGTVFRNETSMNKTHTATSNTETPNKVDPLGDALSLLKISETNDSNKIKKEHETSAIPEKVTSESEWVPIPVVKSDKTLSSVPIPATESSSPSELDEAMSTEIDQNNNSQDTTKNAILQKSTAVLLELSTSNISLSTPNASVTALATHSNFDTETEGTEANTQEIVASDGVSSETASVSEANTEISTLSETTTNAAVSSETAAVSEAITEATTLTETTTSAAVSSESITETSTLSTFDGTVSANSLSSSEVTQSSEQTSEFPLTSPSGRESTSSPDKTEIPTQSSTPDEPPTSIYPSSDATKGTTTMKEEKSTPTLETKGKTDMEASSPLTTPITDGITSSLTEDTTVHIRTIRKKSLTTLKLALAITFLVISLIAMSVLLAYMVKIKKRTIPYEELSMEP